jgi:3-hydroxymyristoyl/3-hydroxydecanoyl-(acyl carrier protein) dehydratase
LGAIEEGLAMNVVVLPKSTPAGRLPSPLKDVRQQVAEFLDAPLPQDFDLGDGEVRLLEYESDMKKIIRERRPWIIVERCVALKSINNAGKSLYTVWGVSTFTEEMVAGHFPGSPRVPFIDLAKMIAQVAIVAAALQANDPSKAPIGVGSSGSCADADDLIKVPTRVLAKVPLQAFKMGLCIFGNSHVYVQGEQVGTVSGVKYLLRPSPDLAFT